MNKIFRVPIKHVCVLSFKEKKKIQLNQRNKTEKYRMLPERELYFVFLLLYIKS